MKNETIKAFIRLLVAAILMLNSALTAKGLNPIPFDESAFSDVALQVATGLSVIWVWWKNNNVTETAKRAQSYKKALQEDGDGSDSQEVSDEV